MIIEFSGTPSAGKDATIEAMRQNKKISSLNVVDESFLRSPFDDKDFELGILWTIFDTYSEVNQVFNKKASLSSSLTIFNRGLFDRIAFTRLLCSENKHYAEVSKQLEKWLKESHLLHQLDFIFLFLTSYEKAKNRKLKFKLRPNSTFRIVNSRVIEKLNESYLSLNAELGSELPIIIIDDLNHDLSIEQKLSSVSSHISTLR